MVGVVQWHQPGAQVEVGRLRANVVQRWAEPVEVPGTGSCLGDARAGDAVAGRAVGREQLAAELDGRPAGFVLMLDELPDEVTGMEQGFIAYMAVEPGRRREGAGAALLKGVEDEARKRRLPYVSLMVTEDNVAARTLYERAGYSTERRLLCKKL